MREDSLTKLLTRAEAAKYLGVSHSTLVSWAQQKDYNNLPIIKVGRLVRYKVDDLNAYIENRRRTINENK